MRLALLWALGLLGAGSPLPSWPLPGAHPTGDTEEQKTEPEKASSGTLGSQAPQDRPLITLAEMLQTSLPEALRVRLELDGESHILELRQDRSPGPGHTTVVWYQPNGTRMVSKAHTLENCCYQGRVHSRVGSWVSLCTCSGLRGLVVLSPERSYALELGLGDLQGPPTVFRIQDSFQPGHTCAPRRFAPVPTQAPAELSRAQRHLRQQKRDVVTETKVIELVIVADHSEVRRFPNFQRLLNRTLEVAYLLDTFFQPLNVRVALVGLEAWTQHDLVQIGPDPAGTLQNFLRWRRADLLPRLPHDSAQLVTDTSFSGPMVGMTIQNSICSPDFSGGVNMDHSTSILGVASSIAHELGHSLGLSHSPPGASCPCPGPAPAKSCIMEASTDFLPGLNFSNCSRQALEKALMEGMGGCLFERLPGLPSVDTSCGNMFVDPNEQCDCGFSDDCTDPCCDYDTCLLRPGAQCASDGPCCENCQLRPAGWQCRPTRGNCDLPEFCLGNSSQCPPDTSLGDANTRGSAYGSCGRGPDGSYVPCAPRDAICGQLQCQGGRAQPLLGSVRDVLWETLEANGTRINCSWVHLDLGSDVAQPLLALPGTACGPGLVCISQRCQPVDLLGAQECRRKCHGHGVCDSNQHCHCEEGWAPPDCLTPLRAASSLTTGLLLSLLLVLVLMLLGVSYWYRARLHQRFCQLKGSSCQYRAAQSGALERPGPPQRTQLMPGTQALSFLAPPSRPLPPDPVPKRLQAALADRPHPPTRPLPADPLGRRPKPPGPAKPPPPRKPLPVAPQGRRASGDRPGSGTGIAPVAVPSRPAPPPPAAASLYL